MIYDARLGTYVYKIGTKKTQKRMRSNVRLVNYKR